jgi:hypothetical protein
VISAEQLKALVNYNRATGVFTWKIDRRGQIKAGDKAGGPDGKGYLRVRLNGRIYKCHRLAWLYEFGNWPRGHIDHKDGNRSNNAIANLRDVDHATNLQNRTDHNLGKKYRLPLGVSMDKQYFRARITFNGKRYSLGHYRSREEAANAYERAKSALAASGNADILPSFYGEIR